MNSKRLGIIFWFVGLNVFLPTLWAEDQPPKSILINQGHGQYRFETFSKTQTVDRIYKSMTGPKDTRQFFLLGKKSASNPPELLWVTGFQSEVLDPQTNANKSEEYICHNQFKFNRKTFNRQARDVLFHNQTHQDLHLAILGQGATKRTLPKGFGIPILSTESMGSLWMVLNNQKTSQPFQVRLKSSFDFIRDKELSPDTPMKPLFHLRVAILVPVPKGTPSASHCSTDEDFEENAQPVLNERNKIQMNGKHLEQSVHWLVPPGRHRYRYRLENLNIPFDTTVHYITSHLHGFGQYIELKDLTAQKIIFRSRAKNYQDRIGIASLEHYSSVQGIPVFKDHAYELTCEYNNPTSEPIDAMASMYLYLWDKDFDRKAWRPKEAQGLSAVKSNNN